MISVIVPVYKAEKYLHRCVDSILAQTYTDFELLLIDDGSPDLSGEICDEYAHKDFRIRVFHKPNGGVSSARNMGLDNARGEWINFVDSDDWVTESYLEELIKYSDADFVLSGFVGIPDGRMVLADDFLYEGDSIKDFIRLHQNDLLRGPCGDLLKLSLINNNGVRFDTRIRYGEDTVFNYQYLCFCNRVRTISSCNYNYFHESERQGKCLTQKYNLSLSEAEYALRRLIEIKKKLNLRMPFDLEDNLSIDIYTFVNVCPVVCMLDDAYLKGYYRFCRTITQNISLKDFYNSELFSPIIRGIAELKSLYLEKRYVEATALSSGLNKLIQNTPKIDFRCRDFYLWSYLIQKGKYKVLDILLRVYMFLKNIWQ